MRRLLYGLTALLCTVTAAVVVSPAPAHAGTICAAPTAVYGIGCEVTNNSHMAIKVADAWGNGSLERIVDEQSPHVPVDRVFTLNAGENSDNAGLPNDIDGFRAPVGCLTRGTILKFELSLIGRPTMVSQRPIYEDRWFQGSIWVRVHDPEVAVIDEISCGGPGHYPPDTPTNDDPTAPVVSVTGTSSSTVSLSWAVRYDLIYEVYRNGSRIAGAAGSYTDTGLSSGTTYGYAVRASNLSGESVMSATVYATTSAAAVVTTLRKDYNSDGRNDIVSVRDDCLHRWWGNGSGGFTYAGTYGCGWAPYAASLTATGDINRDGRGDLIAVRDDCLHRWWGNGSGGFNYAGTYGCGWTPYASTLTATGDLNRDGVGDIVAVRDNYLHRWYGDGSGGFTYAGDWGEGWAAYEASLTGPGDMNGDRVGDLVAVRDDCLHKWYGNGSGGFTYQGTVGCGWTPYASTLAGAGDITGNGIGDLLSTHGDCLHRWYGYSSGGYNYGNTYGCGWTPYPLD